MGPEEKGLPRVDRARGARARRPGRREGRPGRVALAPAAAELDRLHARAGGVHVAAAQAGLAAADLDAGLDCDVVVRLRAAALARVLDGRRLLRIERAVGLRVQPGPHGGGVTADEGGVA